MAAILMSSMLTPTAATASSAAANYPATAAMVPGVLRGWQSVTVGTSWLQFDLGSIKSVSGVALQAIIGASLSGNVLADTSNPPVTNRGTLVIATDANGRAKASLAFSAGVRYVRFNLTASGVVGCGSAFVFGLRNTLVRGPLYGATSITCIDPQVSNELRNGIVETYDAGPASTEIELGFAPSASDDIDLVRRSARAGPCWLDLGDTARDRQWPVRYVKPNIQRRLDRFNRESQSVPLREIT